MRGDIFFSHYLFFFSMFVMVSCGYKHNNVGSPRLIELMFVFRSYMEKKVNCQLCQVFSWKFIGKLHFCVCMCVLVTIVQDRWLWFVRPSVCNNQRCIYNNETIQKNAIVKYDFKQIQINCNLLLTLFFFFSFLFFLFLNNNMLKSIHLFFALRIFFFLSFYNGFVV